MVVLAKKDEVQPHPFVRRWTQCHLVEKGSALESKGEEKDGRGNQLYDGLKL